MEHVILHFARAILAFPLSFIDRTWLRFGDVIKEVARDLELFSHL